ncbi:PepSY domain-containing protein [bacterium]|nr:PepSY domain-containing protein [bacterium]
MKKKLIIAAILGLTGTAHAKKSCTDQPKDKWMTEEAFKSKVEGQGYKIRKFKQPGTCYEIYGTNKEGQKVEVYFNPVDASVVKEEID